MAPSQRTPSMASRARGELTEELARFWRAEVTEGRLPWRERPMIEFARFTAWIRCQLEGAVPELRESETNMSLSRILVRLSEFLVASEQVQLGLEVELAEGFLKPPRVDVRNEDVRVPVLPPSWHRGVLQGGAGTDAGLMADLADAVRKLGRRAR